MLSKVVLSEARELIGSRLREIREERKLTCEQLAEQVGCATSTISRIESGRFFPSLEQLLTILNELDCCIVFNDTDSASDVLKKLRHSAK